MYVYKKVELRVSVNSVYGSVYTCKMLLYIGDVAGKECDVAGKECDVASMSGQERFVCKHMQYPVICCYVY